MDRNALRRRLQVLSLAVVFTLAVLDGARSDDKFPAASPRAANESAADNENLTEDIRQLREAVRELRDAVNNPPAARPEAKPAPDDALAVKFFRLQVADVDEVSGLLELLPDVSFKILGQGKRVAVVAPASRMQHVAEAIAEADRLPPQVQVTALMYEVPVEGVDQLGLRSQVAYPTSSGSITRMATSHDFSTLVREVGQVAGARMLARPSIIAWDKQRAAFQSVQAIPFHLLTQTAAGGNIGTTSFREVGVKLEVTARVGDGQDIVLDLHPEYSVVSGERDGKPIIDCRSAETRMTLKSGEAAVLRGLLRRHETEDGEIVETELIMFLTAEVLDRARLAATKQDTR